MPKDLTDFGRCLKIIRINTNEKLKDMSKRIGYTPQHISRVENGKKPVSDKFLRSLVRSYKMTNGIRERIEKAAITHNVSVKHNAEERTNTN